MNININGVNFSGCGNFTIINGRVISGEGMFGNSQKFDEKKNISADGITQITIKSDSTDIIIAASDTTNTIDAHFCGEAITDAKPNLNVSKNGREVIVTLSLGGCLMSSKLTLLVTIPIRTFERLKASSYNGGIVVKDNVSATKMKLDTYNGVLECEGNFAELFASTHNGNIYVCTNAKSDVDIESITHNGNVTVELQNIATSDISVATANGSARNRFRGTTGGYTAYGRAESYNGNVDVR